jgi:hypothetical protein
MPNSNCGENQNQNQQQQNLKIKIGRDVKCDVM